MKLSPTQQSALRLVKEEGTLHAYNGVSRATISVLERVNLVEVTWSVHTWTNYKSKRSHMLCDWSAKIKEN